MLAPLVLALSLLLPASAAFAADAVPPATPKAACGPGSIPEPGLQGRVAKADVDSGAAAKGYRCNITVIGRSGATGGFRVHRYVDRAGRECAYYDTTLLFPTNTFNLSLEPTGVAVLDMTHPARPVRTTTLATPAMQTPHESLNISTDRGVLAAVLGNPTRAPGGVDLYDISKDCRHPEPMASAFPASPFGHESGMAPDGRTFYPSSAREFSAVDIADLRVPRALYTSDKLTTHGLSISDDGRRGYLASIGDGMVVIDLSEVQDRKPSPQVREIGRVTWPTMTIPQVAIPVTIDGRPYVVEVDEYSATESGRVTAHGPRVGAARIIDVEDETRPRVVSDIRLEVHQPEHRAAIADDYGAQNPTQGYAAHYCNVPRRVDPEIMACSMILSGLRVFDIRDPKRPREIAYFVAPPDTISLTGGPVVDERANWAMSQPAFVPERGEIWYSDGTSGFYALKVAPGVWPFTAATARGVRSCAGKARIRLPRLGGRRIVSAVARRGDRAIAARRGRSLRTIALPRGARGYTVEIRLRTRGVRGAKRIVVITRRVPPCRPGRSA